MWQPAVTRTTLTVQASGTPWIPPNPYTATSGKGHVTKGLIGSNLDDAVARVLAPLRGTLTGSLSATGKPTLKSKGKAVSTLKAGRYKFAITDRDPEHAFTIQTAQGKATGLTGAAFVGTRSKTVTLKAGQWMYSSGLGKTYAFRVTG
jgi:hypothetical protein